MTAHSSIVGGSTADRILNCPGSWQAAMALPPSADVSSEYADEGTAMHDVMAMLMRDRQQLVGRPGMAYYLDRLAGVLGATFHDRALTQEHIDTMIEPALEALIELEQIYGGDFDVLAVEASCAFPGIPGAFGTIDLMLGNDTNMLHVDWKFGQGVGVKAIYDEGDSLGQKLNPQMMFYTVACHATARHLYKGKELVIAIVQPRGADPLTHAVVAPKELKWFREDLHNAVARALDRAPHRSKGEHCRFAPCKINCPLWTGPLLDLSALGPVPQARTDAVSKEVTPYGEYLARAKALVDIVEMFKKTLDEQLHAYLEDGGIVPGWRLKYKTKQRQWIDDKVVNDELAALGFEQDDIWQYKLQTFAATDKTAKRLGVKIPDHLRVAPPTTETTVCQTDDPAPVVERQLAIEQFRASLKALQT
jgi:Protein of unknown function (DUF2800)